SEPLLFPTLRYLSAIVARLSTSAVKAAPPRLATKSLMKASAASSVEILSHSPRSAEVMKFACGDFSQSLYFSPDGEACAIDANSSAAQTAVNVRLIIDPPEI